MVTLKICGRCYPKECFNGFAYSGTMTTTFKVTSGKNLSHSWERLIYLEKALDDKHILLHIKEVWCGNDESIDDEATFLGNNVPGAWNPVTTTDDEATDVEAIMFEKDVTGARDPVIESSDDKAALEPRMITFFIGPLRDNGFQDFGIWPRDVNGPFKQLENWADKESGKMSETAINMHCQDVL